MRVNKKIRPMENLGDDMLALICSYITDPKDLKSLSLVSKTWLRIQRLQRSTLRVLDPSLLPSFLPSFPNLLKFEASTTISNALMHFIAETCPRIQVFHLLDERTTFCPNFDGEGLSAISKGCRGLREIVIRRSVVIENVGIASLAEFSRNLRSLDLEWCSTVSDEILESIGSMNSLETLNLKSCRSITDVGLAVLTKGSLCKTLRRLSLAECYRITDFGLIYLKNMSSLQALNLAGCGVMITDFSGVKALAEIRSLVFLDLSWLHSLSDATMLALVRNCKKLEVLNLTGCTSISKTSVRALSGHESLKMLYLKSLGAFINGRDLEHIVFGCNNLKYIALDGMLRYWVSMSQQDNISKRDCVLHWKPFIY